MESSNEYVEIVLTGFSYSGQDPVTGFCEYDNKSEI